MVNEMGRPKKAEGDKRNRSMAGYVTAEEKEAFCRDADRLHISEAAYVRKALFFLLDGIGGEG